MPSLLLKLVVTPALIAGATLVGRRWGDRLSGWLVGLPLASEPVPSFRDRPGQAAFALATIGFQRVSLPAFDAASAEAAAG